MKIPPNGHGRAAVLPYHCAAMLAHAAGIEDDRERRKAVDGATAYTKLNYPQFFKEETNETANH